MQRILAGSAKGMKLEAFPGLAVRPALAKVRTSLFGILAPEIVGLPCIDLFAGTGSIGIEALSRGASGCVFVERDPRVAGVLERNIAATHLGDGATVLISDVFNLSPGMFPLVRLCGGGRAPADLVFVNPPYALWDDADQTARLWALLSEAHASGRLSPTVRFVAEHHHKQIPLSKAAAHAVPLDIRQYGQTVLTFAVPSPAAVLAEFATPGVHHA